MTAFLFLSNMSILLSAYRGSRSADALIVRAVEDIDTTTSRKWAPTNRPVCPSAGVYPARAGAADGDTFRELTEPHRRELLVHCYRMLASFQDAEDALQDTLLAAWRSLGGFDGRASIRTWL